jgi:hypothetical protein
MQDEKNCGGSGRSGGIHGKMGAENSSEMQRENVRNHVLAGHALRGRGQWCDGSWSRSLLRGSLTCLVCGCGRSWCGSGCVRGWIDGMAHGSRCHEWTGGERRESRRETRSGTRLRGRWSARSRCTLRCCRWWCYLDRSGSLRCEMSCVTMAVWGTWSLHVQSDQSRDEKTCGWMRGVVLGRVRESRRGGWSESRRWCGNGPAMRCGCCGSRRSWCRGTRGCWWMA